VKIRLQKRKRYELAKGKMLADKHLHSIEKAGRSDVINNEH